MRDGRRPQSTVLGLALDGWRDYGNTYGRLRAMTDGSQSARTVLALNGRRDARTDGRTETPRRTVDPRTDGSRAHGARGKSGRSAAHVTTLWDIPTGIIPIGIVGIIPPGIIPIGIVGIIPPGIIPSGIVGIIPTGIIPSGIVGIYRLV